MPPLLNYTSICRGCIFGQNAPAKTEMKPVMETFAAVLETFSILTGSAVGPSLVKDESS